MLALALQTVLSFAVSDEGPVRFGVPVAVEHLQRGLRLRGAREGRLQVRPLTSGAGETVWVECAVLGVRGTAKLALGQGRPATAQGVLEWRESRKEEPGAQVRRFTWVWADGSEDRRVERHLRAVWSASDGEVYTPGEVFVDAGPAFLERRSRVRIAPKRWRRLGLLPPADGSGEAVRDQLLAALAALETLPGRGRGDYGRSDGVVTNLEFDTTLAFVRLALLTGESELWRRAHESARHLVAIDLDRGSGLPFRHGDGHRVAAPEPGHVWITGPLLCALLLADRPLLEDVLGIARSLAAAALAWGSDDGIDRMRDEAWPLGELEAAIAWAGAQPGLVRAADQIAAQILSRWDPTHQVFRYGEALTRGEALQERAWLMGGMLLPALEAHHRRTGDRRIPKILSVCRRRLERRILEGKPGLPLRYFVSGGRSFGGYRLGGVPEGVFLLEGLTAKGRARCLRRASVQRALEGLLPVEHPDLATRWSMIGRCAWVYR